MVTKVIDAVTRSGMYRTLTLISIAVGIIATIGWNVYDAGATRRDTEIKEIKMDVKEWKGKVVEVKHDFTVLDTTVTLFIVEQRRLTDNIVKAIEKIRDN